MLTGSTRQRIELRGDALVPRYHVTISGPDEEAMAELVQTHGLDILRQTARRNEGEKGGYSVAAIADDDQLKALKTAGFSVERHEDVDELARAHLAEVGGGNRYERRV